jgi:hypothetical protein
MKVVMGVIEKMMLRLGFLVSPIQRATRNVIFIPLRQLNLPRFLSVIAEKVDDMHCAI